MSSQEGYFVRRDDQGRITAVYTVEQTGEELEFLPGAYPEIFVARSWEDIRAERSVRLAASDWTQLADADLTEEQKEAWAEYRQELRDIPEAFPDADSVVWPDTP